MAPIGTGTLLPSAARTASVNSADVHNRRGARGVSIYINVTAIVANPSLVFAIQEKDPVSGTYTTVLQSAAITGVGHTILMIMPGATAANNLVANRAVPPIWRVAVTAGDADSITYSVGYALHS